MTAKDNAFSRGLVKKILRAAYQKALPPTAVASKTLAKSLDYFDTSDTEGELIIPQYWAAILNHGRPGFGVKAGGSPILVWFKDAAQDPRNLHGYPVKIKDRLNLQSPSNEPSLAAAIEHDKRIIKELRKAGLKGPINRKQIPALQLAIAKRVGPAVGFRFFDNAIGGGMEGFAAQAAEIINAEFDQHVKGSLAQSGGPVKALTV